MAGLNTNEGSFAFSIASAKASIGELKKEIESLQQFAYQSPLTLRVDTTLATKQFAGVRAEITELQKFAYSNPLVLRVDTSLVKSSLSEIRTAIQQEIKSAPSPSIVSASGRKISSTDPDYGMDIEGIIRLNKSKIVTNSSYRKVVSEADAAVAKERATAAKEIERENLLRKQQEDAMFAANSSGEPSAKQKNADIDAAYKERNDIIARRAREGKAVSAEIAKDEKSQNIMAKQEAAALAEKARQDVALNAQYEAGVQRRMEIESKSRIQQETLNSQYQAGVQRRVDIEKSEIEKQATLNAQYEAGVQRRMVIDKKQRENYSVFAQGTTISKPSKDTMGTPIAKGYSEGEAVAFQDSQFQAQYEAGVQRRKNIEQRLRLAGKMDVKPPEVIQPGFIQSELEKIPSAFLRLGRYYAAFQAYQTAFSTISGVMSEVAQFNEKGLELKKFLPAGSDISDLTDRVYELGKTYGVTSKIIFDSYITFAQQGLKTNEILGATGSALLAVNVASVDYADAVKFLTTSSKIWNVDMANSATLVDKLAKVQAISAVTSQQMIDAISRTGSTAKDAGVSMEVLQGYIAAITERTQQSGEVTGTAIKAILQRVQRPDSMEKLQNIAPLKDIAFMGAGGEVAAAPDILSKIAAKWKDLTDIQRESVKEIIAGRHHVNSFTSLMENFGNAQKITTEAMLSFNFAMKTNEIQLAKLGSQFQIMKNQAIEPFVIAGEKISPMLGGIIKFLNDFNVVSYMVTGSLIALGSAMTAMMMAGSLGLGGARVLAGSMMTFAPEIIAVGVVTLALASYFDVLGIKGQEAANKNKDLIKSLSDIADGMRDVSAASDEVKQKYLDDKLGKMSPDQLSKLKSQGFALNFSTSGKGISSDPQSLRGNELVLRDFESGTKPLAGPSNIPKSLLEYLKTQDFTKNYTSGGGPSDIIKALESRKSSLEKDIIPLSRSMKEDIAATAPGAIERSKANREEVVALEALIAVYKTATNVVQIYQSVASFAYKPTEKEALVQKKIDIEALKNQYLDWSKVAADNASKNGLFADKSTDIEQFSKLVGLQKQLREESAKLKEDFTLADATGQSSISDKQEKNKIALEAVDQAVRQLTLSYVGLSDGMVKGIDSALSFGRNMQDQFAGISGVIGSAASALMGFIGYLNKSYFMNVVVQFAQEAIQGNVDKKYQEERAKLDDLKIGVKKEIDKSKKEAKDKKSTDIQLSPEVEKSLLQIGELEKSTQKVAGVVSEKTKVIADAHTELATAQAQVAKAGADSAARSGKSLAEEKAHLAAMLEVKKQEAQVQMDKKFDNYWAGKMPDSYLLKYQQEKGGLTDEISAKERAMKIPGLKTEEIERYKEEIALLQYKLKLLGDNESKAVEINNFEKQAKADKVRISKAQQEQSYLAEYAGIKQSMLYSPTPKDEEVLQRYLLDLKIQELEIERSIRIERDNELAARMGLNEEQRIALLQDDTELANINEKIAAEQKRHSLIKMQTEAKINAEAMASTKEIQGSISSALFSMVSPTERNARNQQRAQIQGEIDGLQQQANNASMNVATAQRTGNIDQINAAQQQWIQVNNQLTQAQQKMKDLSNNTNKWKELLTQIGSAVMKKLVDSLTEVLFKSTGLDKIFTQLFSGISGLKGEGGGGTAGLIPAGGGAMGAMPLMAMAGKGFLGGGGGSDSVANIANFASSPSSGMGGMVLQLSGGGAQAGVGGGMGQALQMLMGGGGSFGGAAASAASSYSGIGGWGRTFGNVADTYGGGAEAASGGGGLFGGGIMNTLGGGLIGYGVGKATKSRGAGALAGGVSGFLMGGITGAIVGVLGGLFGGGGDNEEKPAPPPREFYPMTKNTEALDRLTSSLMKLNEGVFNAPGAFEMPKLQAKANMSGVTINQLTVTVGSGSNISAADVTGATKSGIVEGYKSAMALFGSNPSSAMG